VTGETPDVTIYEVGPRDGLQNEPRVISSEAKLELVGRLGRAGLRRVEVTSFVSPRWIPQLADADAVAAAVPKLPGVVYSALVPNPRGYERLRKAETVAVAAVFLSASETHNRRNLNCSIAEQLERLGRVAERARSDQVPLRAYVSTVCGCPYEGAVAPSAVVQLVPDPGPGAGRGRRGAAGARRAPPARHLRPRAGEPPGGLRGRRAHLRCGAGRAGRLPLRTGRLRQRGHRGRGGSLRGGRGGHRHRAGLAGGHGGLARASGAGPHAARSGDPGPAGGAAAIIGGGGREA
jgi:hypothetical protein